MRLKPSSAKGTYVKSIAMSSTHGTWHQNRTENGDCLIRKLNYNDSN